MAKVIYTAEAHVTGGRADGHGESSDGKLAVDLRLPSELGSQGGGTNPEELFAVGFAAASRARWEWSRGAASSRPATWRSTPT